MTASCVWPRFGQALKCASKEMQGHREVWLAGLATKKKRLELKNAHNDEMEVLRNDYNMRIKTLQTQIHQKNNQIKTMAQAISASQQEKEKA